MPMASPLTAATTGFSAVDSAPRKRGTGGSPPAGGTLRKSPRSLPAVKASPLPVIRITRTDASSAAPTSASAIAPYIACVSAFFFSGRFMAIVRTAPSRPTTTWLVLISVSPKPRSAENFEQAGGAHAAADAHGHDTVLGLAAAAL